MKVRARAVVYGEPNNKSATAEIVFNEKACAIAGIDLNEQEVEKLLVPPKVFNQRAYSLGWSSKPDIQFKSGRVIRQNYQCNQGEFQLFDFKLIKD